MNAGCMRTCEYIYTDISVVARERSRESRKCRNGSARSQTRQQNATKVERVESSTYQFTRARYRQIVSIQDANRKIDRYNNNYC